MVLSMTGYGRARLTLHGRDITVEIKSVNSRYFEYSSRMPRGYSFLEDKLKKLVNGKIARGKAELNLTIVNVEAPDTVITPNIELARQYKAAMDEMARQLDMRNDVSLSGLCRFPDMFSAVHAEADEAELWQDVQAVAAAALENFAAMRAAEGEKLREDVLARLCTLEKDVGFIEQTSAARVQKYTDKLYARLKELLDGRDIDDARILTEAAIFADKTAVDEETVRLRSHIASFRDILGAFNGPIGRKLDFLVQEMNREANTIASKSNDLEITRAALGMKNEIEKIREQIQNLE